MRGYEKAWKGKDFTAFSLIFHCFRMFSIILDELLEDVEGLLDVFGAVRCFEKAWKLLQKHRDCLDRVAEELCEVETITGDRLREIIAEYTEVFTAFRPFGGCFEVPEKLAVV